MGDESREVNRRRFLQGTGVAVAGAALGAGTAAADERSAADGEMSGRPLDGDEPAVIAHRGFAGVYPENTVGAVRESAKGGRSNDARVRGADMIEIDIVPTADGDVVVFHDDGLAERDGGERGLTDKEGIVWETPTEEVLSAEVLESGETVPLLTEVMDAIPPSVGVNVEFKNPGSEDVRFAENLDGDELEAQKDLWRPFTERALEIVAEYENEILVSSFYEAAIATVRETDPSVPVAFLFWDSIEDGLDITREYDCEALHPPLYLIRGTPFFGDEWASDVEDVDLVEVAHEEGRTVNVWTTRSWYEAERLRAVGVDGIISDFPGLLRFGSRNR
ncbi:glycerophosphodiester phosphodiesterase [Halegenticoccus tardaugens]|uniref:glycerophosphodiester phosphodiesterase n=1 Tax=Halegenticoccus tardaugens TaxID=2071624 RepID=UPI00100A7827|nr:glycerophosphodiester phosphodiesterase [Halegenticoccus tardaugens]